MSRSKYSQKRPWQWPGWARNLFIDRPYRRRRRMEERKALKQSDLEEMVWTERPKLPWWD